MNNGIQQISAHLERERDRLNAAIGALRPLVPKSSQHANVIHFHKHLTKKHWTQTAAGRRRLSAIGKARWAKRAA